MRIIAITGGIGSGKTTVAGWIRETGVPVIDADRISRRLTKKGGEALPAIRAAFGDTVFHADGTLDRAVLADLVFSEDPAMQQNLNAILHPMVIERMQRELDALETRGAPEAVIEVPLLYEAGMERMADTVICVTAAEETRLKRLTERSNLTRRQALARMRAQQDVNKTEALADYVLATDGPTRENKQAALRLWQRITEKTEA
ncbi:MAG: dephospho-CoA kinase [Clostridiales bacterium]|nr:dephospho-CoA kinase [Clostridiales bacterium]